MNSPTPPSDIQSTPDVPLLAGRYQLFDKLGEGGMGAVWRARDIRLNRFVAVKLLPAGKLQDADAVARFRREALALAKLSHPHIIQAYDSGQEAEKQFLVMELVEGRSLMAELKDHGRLPPTRAADYARQAALALHHAHKLGLIHRDVKPSNLLLDAEGRIKLLDLGLARFLQDQIGGATLTREGACMGTPDYCSPEQFLDAHQADARSDIYSLGCTLYHLIAGQPPFPGSSLSEKFKAHDTREPPPLEDVCPEIPGGLALAIGRMLAKRPADRFASMAEAAEALSPYIAASSASFRDLRNTSTWTGSRLQTVTDRRRRQRRRWFAAAGLLALLLLPAGLTFVLMRSAPQSTGKEIGKTEPPLAGNGKGNDARPIADGNDPNVLTVSKDAQSGGRFRTLREAVEAVEHPNMTIHVLDDAEYAEAIVLRGASRAGLTVESPRRAILGKGVLIEEAAGVTIRGFRIRLQSGSEEGGVRVRGACPGVVLEQLEIDSPKRNAAAGISVESVRPAASDPPLLIRDCTITHCSDGVRIGGESPSREGPSGRVVLSGNLLEGNTNGVTLTGQLQDVRIVANRIAHCTEAGICVRNLKKASDSILIANNTIVNIRDCLQLRQPIERAENIRIRNNLFLAQLAPDISFDGNAAALASWGIDHNARPVFAVRAAADSSPVPPAHDLTTRELGSLVLRPPMSIFPRPAKGSALATAGAGKEDPSLPTYIGAVPPDGVASWDWDRGGRMPPEARLLTVSKNKAAGGKYRTINDALKEARRWDTIRVLDAAAYQECLSLKDKTKYEGLSLEAPKRATLVMVKGDHYAVEIRGIPHLRIRGFRFRDRDQTPSNGRVFLFATGDLTGTTLADLDITSDTFPMGITLQQVSAQGEPLIVTGCSLDTLNDGITIVGNPAIGACRGIRLSANRVRSTGPGTRGILLAGALQDVQVTGNLVYDCKTVGVQLEDPASSLQRVLIANNTICNCRGMGFRLLENRQPRDHIAGQVDFSNNLLLGCGLCDAGYLIFTGATSSISGDREELVKLWRFRGNVRDMMASRVGLQIPLTDTDRMLQESDLLTVDPHNLNRIRPASKSPLTTFGVRGGSGLPAYVGALPPEGVEDWDWDRTWRTRHKPEKK